MVIDLDYHLIGYDAFGVVQLTIDVTISQTYNAVRISDVYSLAVDRYKDGVFLSQSNAVGQLGYWATRQFLLPWDASSSATPSETFAFGLWHDFAACMMSTASNYYYDGVYGFGQTASGVGSWTRPPSSTSGTLIVTNMIPAIFLSKADDESGLIIAPIIGLDGDGPPPVLFRETVPLDVTNIRSVTPAFDLSAVDQTWTRSDPPFDPLSGVPQEVVNYTARLRIA